MYYNIPETYSPDGRDNKTHPVMYCLDQYTGELIWRRDLPGSGSGGYPTLFMEQRYKSDPRVGIRAASSYRIILSIGGYWEVDPLTGATLYFNQDIKGADNSYHDGAPCAWWAGRAHSNI